MAEKTGTLLKASHDEMIKNITECISELASLVRTSKSKEVRKSAAGCLSNALRQVINPEHPYPDYLELNERDTKNTQYQATATKLAELINEKVHPKDNILNDVELNEFMEIIQQVQNYIKGENHGREVDS